MKDVLSAAARLLEAEVHPVEVDRTDADPSHKSGREEADPAVVDQQLALALGRQDPDASEEEKLLHRLVAQEQPILDKLNEVELRLAIAIDAGLDDLNRAFMRAKVLRELIAVSTAINRRQQNVAAAAMSLRAQRRMLQRAQGGSR